MLLFYGHNMRIELDDIAVSDILDTLRRLGIAPERHVRIVCEPLDAAQLGDGDFNLDAINAASGSFDFLKEEPDLYSDTNLARPAVYSRPSEI